MKSASRILFVTGTDTGVGKTLVSRALLAAWRRRGLQVSAYKPLETGLSADAKDSDAAQLAEAAGQSITDCCYLRFEPPLAPQAAAQKSGTSIDPQALIAACRSRANPYALVEGAGGLLVPIAAGFTMADLAQALDAMVLVVARARLGTINHTLLTLAECRRRGLRVLGVVLNRSDGEIGPDDADNAALIAAHSAPYSTAHSTDQALSVFGPLPHLPGAKTETLADAADGHLPVPEMFAACYLRRP